jgi:chorismate synthase
VSEDSLELVKGRLSETDGAVSDHTSDNDPFVDGVNPITGEQTLRTTTNWSGGIQGGISNGDGVDAIDKRVVVGASREHGSSESRANLESFGRRDREHGVSVTGEQTLRTTTNWSGGIQGGISNGEDIYFR